MNINNSSSSNHSGVTIDVNTGYRVLFALQCFIMTSSIAVNSFLLFVLIKYNLFSVSTTLLLKFQCITDLTASGFGIPVHMIVQTSHVLLPESFSRSLCAHVHLKFALESLYLFPLGYSLFTHTLLAIDRFVATKCQLDYQRIMSTKRLVIAIISLIIMTSISIASVYTELGVNVSRGTMERFNACEHMIALNYNLVSIALAWNTLIPISVAFCLYIAIFVIIKKETAKVTLQDTTIRNTSGNTSGSTKARNAVTKSTAIILVGCSLCGLPIVVLYYSSHAVSKILGSVNATFFLMAGHVSVQGSSLINPIVLFCASSKLRQMVRAKGDSCLTKIRCGCVKQM